ncbi:hypothetical protein IC232_05320 [Microvirga sp. BT688]|uniref:hypothetical protein n=1 Tax=Microvirga sp. TaxID=1873136 RepID=UPI00168568C4|nr:hypothetical protein [Microvirga sp.]MBD2746118.1 hypothetical protein [Microvirga sp.]
MNAAYKDAVTLIQHRLQAISQLATYLMMHLAAPDPVIRTTIRDNSNLPTTVAGSNTQH